MSRPLPYFKFYPGDYLCDQRVQSMTLEEEGAYLRILANMWQAKDDSCSLLDNPDVMAPILKVSKAGWKRIRSSLTVLKPVLQVKGGRLYNSRLSEEFAKAKEIHQTRVDAANGLSREDVNRMHKQTLGQTIEQTHKQTLGQTGGHTDARTLYKARDIPIVPDPIVPDPKSGGGSHASAPTRGDDPADIIAELESLTGRTLDKPDRDRLTNSVVIQGNGTWWRKALPRFRSDLEGGKEIMSPVGWLWNIAVALKGGGESGGRTARKHRGAGQEPRAKASGGVDWDAEPNHL